jgi:hypothetical protein
MIWSEIYMRQRKLEKRNGVFTRAKRFSASLLVVGLMTLGGRANAIDSRPLMNNSHKEKANPIIVMFESVSKIVNGTEVKVMSLAIAPPAKAKSPIYFKRFSKPPKLKQIRRIMKPFKPMTKPEKSKHK